VVAEGIDDSTKVVCFSAVLYATGTRVDVGAVADDDIGRELPQRLLQALYGVPNPGPQRTDLLAIFLTGMKTTKEFTIQTTKGPVKLPPAC
jgi:hypothetical protein